MSAPGALVLALSALLVLGTVAGWLINLPLWLIAVFLGVGAWVIRRVYRRLSRSRVGPGAGGP